jgi:D-alanyl-D-alanine carboxypeptidase
VGGGDRAARLRAISTPPQLKLAGLALIVLIVAGCGDDGPSPPDTAQVQAALDEAVAAGAPGLALELRGPQGDEFMSAGKASLDPPEPIRPGDRYRIASVTKAFTAALAMQLVAEGDLSLDDTVAQIDPGLVSDGGEMTVSDLLGHTSGLADYVKDKEFAELVSNGERLTPEQVLGLVADDPLEFAPGSAYGYSDTDNIVLGLLIEQVTGNPYEEELRTRVLEPLDLTDTTLATDFDFPEPHAQGYQFDPEDDSAAPEDVTDVPIDPNGAWASGALISTPADMATFFEALLGGELVPAAQLEEMMETRPGAGSPPGPGTNNAGLGIFRWEVSCGEIWGHTGSFPGFRALGAATEDGSGAIGMVVNATELPEEAEQAVLRAQELAACYALDEPVE